jgi:hypothetical protein
MSDLKIKQQVYFSRIVPSCYIYDVCDLIVRTVKDDWFVAIDKRDKHAYLFNDIDIGKIVFTNRKEALDKVLFAEANKKELSNETEIYYEEY